MKKKLLKGKKGFTLIELIVVIAILAVLAALALPTFSGLIDTAKENTADANARTIYTAARAYLAVNPNANSVTTSDIQAYLGNDFTEQVEDINITVTTGGEISVTAKTDSVDGEYPDGDK